MEHANKSIGCAVNKCANHCKAEDYCSLNQVNIGTHESNPKKVECVDCNSFKPE